MPKSTHVSPGQGIRPWVDVKMELVRAFKGNPNADVTELRRELKESRLADYIARVVDEAPPLSDEQRVRLAALIRGGGSVA